MISTTVEYALRAVVIPASKYDTSAKRIGVSPHEPLLAKLHGSVDTDGIVPPTWKKSANNAIQAQWHAAHVVLKEANHIRFIGYSLPITDAYVQYLLKASLAHVRHLKNIDVINLDWGLTVKHRYDDLIPFKRFRYVNADVADYLRYLHRGEDNLAGMLLNYPDRERRFVEFGNIESRHEDFMRSHGDSESAP